MRKLPALLFVKQAEETAQRRNNFTSDSLSAHKNARDDSSEELSKSQNSAILFLHLDLLLVKKS
jgi:hypothetical protein